MDILKYYEDTIKNKNEENDKKRIEDLNLIKKKLAETLKNDIDELGFIDITDYNKDNQITFSLIQTIVLEDGFEYKYNIIIDCDKTQILIRYYPTACFTYYDSNVEFFKFSLGKFLYKIKIEAQTNRCIFLENINKYPDYYEEIKIDLCKYILDEEKNKFKDKLKDHNEKINKDKELKNLKIKLESECYAEYKELYRKNELLKQDVINKFKEQYCQPLEIYKITYFPKNIKIECIESDINLDISNTVNVLSENPNHDGYYNLLNMNGVITKIKILGSITDIVKCTIDSNSSLFKPIQILGQSIRINPKSKDYIIPIIQFPSFQEYATSKNIETVMY